MCDSVESMLGSAEPLNEGEKSWDDEMKSYIKHIHRMFKRNNLELV